MNSQDQWEYRVRVAVRGSFHLLGGGDPSRKQSSGEKALAELANQGWELMPMAIPFAENAAGLVFRRQRMSKK